MAKSAHYHVPFRRRRSGKTNFHRRARLLRSGLPRLVVRRSNKHHLVSVVQAEVIGDKILTTASSQHLKQYGWKGATSNVPAAYLTGYLAGKYALSLGIKNAILDIGINSCRKDTRIAAMLCGAVQAGLNIPHDPEIFPSEERISGQIIADFAAKLKKEQPEKYQQQFSGYKKTGAKPESLPTYFKATKKAIDEAFTSKTMKSYLTNRNKKNKAKKAAPKKKATPTKKPTPKPKTTAATKTTPPKKKPTTTTKKAATSTTKKKSTTSTGAKKSTVSKTATSTKGKKTTTSTKKSSSGTKSKK